MANTIMFIILAVFIIGSALMCVTTTRIMRAATFMLFVLFGVAGIYFLLDYTFLGAAQISVYAGGVTMIYVFAIQLVSKRTLQGLEERVKSSKMIGGGLAALAGLVVVGLILLKTGFFTLAPANVEVPMKEIGTALVGAGKYQYDGDEGISNKDTDTHQHALNQYRQPFRTTQCQLQQLVEPLCYYRKVEHIIICQYQELLHQLRHK